ncbi:hypothetical protein FNV43_RR13090 [Rhamnella rubrinervis]|uniref:Uncharacterized protein n=1 Tax=Rhamnella rubrinervis TaxID=2594499 RepID=A0A8K0MEU4_9ROSA|nr:hypothetical protein FNV43_RR13090 [Rhamnella rubrinervis]
MERGGSPSAPTKSLGSDFSPNGSTPPNIATGTGGNNSPLALSPLAQRITSPDSETELDDLSWLNTGAPVCRRQIVLLDSEVEVEGVRMEVGGSVPAERETDDVVMVDVPASNSSNLDDYKIKTSCHYLQDRSGKAQALL